MVAGKLKEIKLEMNLAPNQYDSSINLVNSRQEEVRIINKVPLISAKY